MDCLSASLILTLVLIVHDPCAIGVIAALLTPFEFWKGLPTMNNYHPGPLLLWLIGARYVLEASTIAGSMVVSGIHTPRG